MPSSTYVTQPIEFNSSYITFLFLNRQEEQEGYRNASILRLMKSFNLIIDLIKLNIQWGPLVMDGWMDGNSVTQPD